MEIHRPHILLVTFPAQGHINPTLQFASRLIQLGVQVTFATSISAHRKISKTTKNLPPGLNFTPFSDGYDDGFKPTDDTQHFMSEIRTRGSQGLKDIIHDSADMGRPVACLVYSLFLPWAAVVARELHLPSALLWIQPATVFDIYYHYFHGYNEVIASATSCNDDDPSCLINLPGLPPLRSGDLPSFLLPSSKNAYSFALHAFKEQMDTLDAEACKPTVLVNTFHALEEEALKCIDKINMIAVGPLIARGSDNAFRVDLFQKSKSYVDWLDSKPQASVVYVSFGSILMLDKKQMEEIARGLLMTGRPFLWVVRGKDQEGGGEDNEENLSCMEELEKNGMIVPWCSQLEVLSHPSLGCFVTHCGWNSTLESLVYGVPVVAFPQWTDQGTNMKLIEDVWRTGVRVREAKEGGFVEGEEIGRCIEMVMGGGERAEEMRRNAKKWRDLGRKAMKEGGSSDKNLKCFVDEVGEFSLARK